MMILFYFVILHCENYKVLLTIKTFTFMFTTLENKIKITIEFDSIDELRKIHSALNCGCVRIHDAECLHDNPNDILYYSEQWDTLTSFAKFFNPANFN